MENGGGYRPRDANRCKGPNSFEEIVGALAAFYGNISQ